MIVLRMTTRLIKIITIACYYNSYSDGSIDDDADDIYISYNATNIVTIITDKDYSDSRNSGDNSK